MTEDDGIINEVELTNQTDPCVKMTKKLGSKMKKGGGSPKKGDVVRLDVENVEIENMSHKKANIRKASLACEYNEDDKKFKAVAMKAKNEDIDLVD